MLRRIYWERNDYVDRADSLNGIISITFDHNYKKSSI